jgi:ATP-binding cassette subfamily B multidrug efflux pump
MKALAHLNKYLLKYKYYLLAGILLVFLNNIFAILVGPLTRDSMNLIGRFIEEYKANTDPSQQKIVFTLFRKELLLLVGQIIGTSIIAGIFLYFQRKTIIGVSRRIEFDLKNDVYHHYQKLPLSFYKKNNTGDLMNRISEDVSHVRNYLGPSIMYGLNLLAIFAVTIPFMVSVNLKLTLFTLLPLPLLALSIYMVNSRITRQSERIQKSQSDLSTLIQEAFSGIRVIKSFVREKDSIQKFEAQSAEYKDSSILLSKIQAWFYPMILTLIGASNIFVIYIGGIEVIKGSITYGNIAEFLIYLNRMSWPVASLGWISSLIQRAEVSQRRINEFLEVQSDIASGNEVPQKLTGAIEFREVGFTYPDTGINALHNISFRVEPGQTLAIVGNTGSGKSTIANLLCRMYEPGSGSILIDGKPVQQYDLQAYRSQLGYVPQDVFLFSDTIRNNIAFGADNLDEEAIRQAARDADLYQNIVDFPQQFDTILGERGITLSGGQKQRLSIARAIVRNPSILLLDDCLSAVDTRTENIILHNLARIMQARTSVIISHRASTVKLAHKILVLDNGSIAEQGSHEELLAQGGLYKELYQKQLQEETNS